MNDAVRQAVVAAIAALRAGTEFAPRAEEITPSYVDVWAAAFADNQVGPQEIVLSAREWMGNHATYPAVGRIVKIALERRDHRSQLARANYYIQDAKALPVGKVQDEDRLAARARLGITDLDIKQHLGQAERDRGNIGGETPGGFRSTVGTALREAAHDEADK